MRYWGFNLTNYMGGGDGLDFSNQTSFKKGMTPWHKGKKGVYSEEYINRLREVNTGKVVSEEVRLKMKQGQQRARLQGKGHSFKKGYIPWNKGQKTSEETLRKLSKIRKGKPSPKKGKKYPLSEKQLENISKTITCPFCNKSGNYYGMLRWHFNNCKFK